MDELGTLLHRVADVTAAYRAGLADRRVSPGSDADALATAFGGPLPTAPTPAGQVLEQLVTAAEPGLLATAGPRFFGFVVGGALPAATAADQLATGWDAVAFNAVTSPAAAAAEAGAGGWVKQLLGVPARLFRAK